MFKSILLVIVLVVFAVLFLLCSPAAAGLGAFDASEPALLNLEVYVEYSEADLYRWLSVF